MEPPPEPHNIAAARSEQRIMAADWSQRLPGRQRLCLQPAAALMAGGGGQRAGWEPATGGVCGRPAAVSWRPRSRRRRAGRGAGSREPPRGRPPARPGPFWRCCSPRRWYSPRRPPRPRPGGLLGQRLPGARGGWRRKKATVEGRGGEGACLPGSLRVCRARFARRSAATADLHFSALSLCNKVRNQRFLLVLYFVHPFSPCSHPTGETLFSPLFCLVEMMRACAFFDDFDSFPHPLFFPRQ